MESIIDLHCNSIGDINLSDIKPIIERSQLLLFDGVSNCFWMKLNWKEATTLMRHEFYFKLKCTYADEPVNKIQKKVLSLYEIQLIDWWDVPMAHWCDMNSNPESNLPDSKKSEMILQQPTGTLNGTCS